jgi:nucleotide-binding universal stress UspA family protein
MSTILAPTRGGELSFPNQDLAIRMAKELDARLIFLYVSDVRFFQHMHVSYFRDLELDLAGMGEFLLTMAQERAEKAGYHAEGIVRSGYFGQILRELIRSEDVSIVLFGAPTEGTGATSVDYLNALFAELVTDFGVEVILADAGEIIERHKPQETQS